MRYSIILILALLSTNLYAASTTNLREEKSLQTETRALFTDGKNTARIIQNAPMKKYFSSVLLRREQDIKTLFSFNTPVKDRYDTTAFDVKKSYYTSILRPGYQSLLSLMKQGNYTSVIDTQTRTQIEAETLGYQQAFLSGITSNLSKYISNEVLLKGNMNFSYRGSGGYIRVSLTEYDTTRSLTRDEQAINMRLTVNMDMTLPGKQECDYSDTWEMSCTPGTGSHIAGNASMKVSMWLMGDQYFIQLHDFTITQSMTGADALIVEQFVKTMKEYTDGKSYTYSVPSSGLSKQDLIMKVYKVLTLINEKSILTPRYRVGDTYILDINPIFQKKLQGIDVHMSLPTIESYPTLSYRNGIYSLDYNAATRDVYHLTLGKDVADRATVSFHLNTFGQSDYLSGMIQENAWNMVLDLPSEGVLFTSMWDGHTTDTIITGSGIAGGLYGTSFEKNPPKKIQITGTLTAASTSLQLFVDGSPMGLFQYFRTTGGFSQFLSWIEYEKNRFEISGNLEERFGSFSINPPKNPININHSGEDSLTKTIDTISSVLTK